METTSPWELVYFLVVLVGVVVLAYYVSKWLSKRLSGGRVQSTKYLNVVDRIVLSQDRVLYVVKVGEKAMLLGVTQNSINKICDIDLSELPEIINKPPSSFSDILKSSLKNGWGINTSNKSSNEEGKNDIDQQ